MKFSLKFKPLFLILILSISCQKDKKYINFEKGTFKIVHHDSSITYISRLNNFQLKYWTNNSDRREFSKFSSNNKGKYEINIINQTSEFDSYPLDIVINKVLGDTFYQTTYYRANKLKSSSQIIKISDTISSELKNLIKNYK